MNASTNRSEKGIPVGTIIVVIGIVGVLGLIALGARQLAGMINIVNIPIAGEWQAKDKPWSIMFRPDKTLVSTTGPSQPGAAQASASTPGTYSVDYFGTLWVKLNNGKIYSAALSATAPNRFDLIESDTEVPTVFERVAPPKPKPPDSPKDQRG